MFSINKVQCEFFMLKIYLIFLAILSLGAMTQVSSQVIPKDFRVTLTRTECYGTCPSYTLNIYSDGRVVFEGIAHVKKIKTHKGRISTEKIQLLLTEFENAGYFSFRDNYTNDREVCNELWTDHPSVKISFKVRGKSKTVHHYHGCKGPNVPKQLTILENKIDELANSNQWVN